MNSSLESLGKKVWWNYIHEDLRELLRLSLFLIEKFLGQKEKIHIHDWAFLVFPAAKAYEGFLKTLFYDLGFINKEQFYGKTFRVGKALNPNLKKHLREKESVYDKLVNFCNGEELPNSLWNTWKKGRNLLFHWFPDEKNVVSFEEARERVEEIISNMDLAYKGCKLTR